MLCSDTIQQISKYANVRSKIKISALSKNCHDVVSKKNDVKSLGFSVKIDNNIKYIFKKKYTEFVKNMIECECVISGSFLLESIYDTKWLDSDVDVYVNTKFLTEKANSKNKSKFETFLFNNYVYKETVKNDEYSIFDSDIFTVRDFYLKEISDAYKTNINLGKIHYNIIDECSKKSVKKIQVISVSSNINEHIINSYDFDICKNIFYYDKNGEPTIKCHKIDDVSSKSTDFNTSKNLGNTVKRYYKYTKRGIRIKNINSDKILEKLKSDSSIFVTVKHAPESAITSCGNDYCLGNFLNLEHSHATINRNTIVTFYRAP